MNIKDKIFVAGHSGLVGSSFLRRLHELGYYNVVTISHKDLDLTRQADVESFFEREKPNVVIDAAALVGGIRANSERMSEFYYVNNQIQQNLIWSSFKNNTRDFLFLGSACMYPRECSQPMNENELLTGIPEPTNEGYALAKIGGTRLCSYLNRQYGVNFISAIPANAYGIGDSFDLKNCHVIPALIRRFYEASLDNLESVTIWGSGRALREFIFTDDLADAGIFLLNNYHSDEPINIGTGSEITMFELANLIKEIVGFNGLILTDPSKPDGMMRRICDSTKLQSLGWKSSVPLKEGLERMFKWYKNSIS